ncbi:hypothetical protein [Aquisalimonas sp.]|uniref:hypothetical protein n=1 Tax=unclassified Aquisalimonas TaxID=2644645 RepID=UPI0025BC271C|nr:hypothetical protein [Aquisalimonas sp.]
MIEDRLRVKEASLRDRPTTEITRLEIVDWRDLRLLEVAPNTVQREFNFLQQVFLRAVDEWGQERGDNPTRGLRPMRLRDERSRRLAPIKRDYLLRHRSFKIPRFRPHLPGGVNLLGQ